MPIIISSAATGVLTLELVLAGAAQVAIYEKFPPVGCTSASYCFIQLETSTCLVLANERPKIKPFTNQKLLMSPNHRLVPSNKGRQLVKIIQSEDIDPFKLSNQRTSICEAHPIKANQGHRFPTNKKSKVGKLQSNGEKLFHPFDDG